MRNIAWRSLCLGLAALGTFTTSLQAQPEPAGFAEIHQVDSPVESRRGEIVRIVNRYGNIRIRAIPNAAEGSMRATIQSTSKDVVPASIQASETVDGPIYQVVPAKSADALIRVDVVVALPDKAGIEVEMADGDFTMHPASYPVRIRADSGLINLRTSGKVDVEVLAGHVIYNPPRDQSPTGGRIQTSGAPVDALLARDVELNFRVTSGVAVTTDSLALLQARTRVGRAVVFAPHADAPQLEILTDHGPVRLVLEGLR